MPTKRTLRKLFFSGLATAAVILLAVIFVVYPLNPQFLIDVRFALFGRIVSSPVLADLPPSQLRADGFLSDQPEVIEKWRVRLKGELGYLNDLPASFQTSPTLEKAKLLATRLSGGGGAGYFGDSALLIDKLRGMPLGTGKCSDYVEGFQALCSIYDIDTFEFTITHHTIAAVHCPELGKWVFVDPQFCLLVRGSQGQYLSPVEMRNTALAGGRLDFHFFGERGRQFARINPYDLGYYDSVEDFHEFIMPYGNNVFAIDAMRSSLSWMPKPIRQLWYWLNGVFPSYMILRDAHASVADRVAPLRYVSVGVCLLLILLCLPYCVLLVSAWLLRMVGDARVVPPTSQPRSSTELPKDAAIETIAKS